MISNIKYLATCSPSIVQGTTKILSLAVTFGGNPPYTLTFTVDGTAKTVIPTWSGSTATFPYTFSEVAGSHTYATNIVDSCSLTSNIDSCTIDITPPTTPTPIGFPPWLGAITIGGLVVGAIYMTKGGKPTSTVK